VHRRCRLFALEIEANEPTCGASVRVARGNSSTQQRSSVNSADNLETAAALPVYSAILGRGEREQRPGPCIFGVFNWIGPSMRGTRKLFQFLIRPSPSPPPRPGPPPAAPRRRGDWYSAGRRTAFFVERFTCRGCYRK